MTVVAWMLPATLLIALIALGGFLWALRNGQFEDLEGAGWRVLDDEIAPPSASKHHKTRETPHG